MSQLWYPLCNGREGGGGQKVSTWSWWIQNYATNVYQIFFTAVPEIYREDLCVPTIFVQDWSGTWHFQGNQLLTSIFLEYTASIFLGLFASLILQYFYLSLFHPLLVLFFLIKTRDPHSKQLKAYLFFIILIDNLRPKIDNTICHTDFSSP